MRNIVIGFSKPKGKKFPIYSWIIRAFCQTPYSHVYLKIKTKWDTNLIYQASGVQVNFMGEEFFNKHVEVIKEFSFEISEENYAEFMKFAITNSGAPYSLTEAVNMVTWKFFRKKLFKIEKEWVCSVLGGYVFDKYIATEKDIFDDHELITPKDVYDACERYLSDI